MSKINLTKKYVEKEYKEKLKELGITHHSEKPNGHEAAYCGWCEHSSLDNGSGYLNGWYLQSCCAIRDMTPVSEFCYCKDFTPTKSKSYRKQYPKLMKSLDDWKKEQ